MGGSLICPRCEQGEVLKAQVKARGVQIFVCDECDAVWFSFAAIGVSPFRDLERYLEEISVAPSWESISVDRHE
ncbi:zf-TFIIB domain-containing protein [Stenotrophomonas sp. CASM110]|uniref:TFIIB-type zinc ribbon-containing protein n=1 Tax=Stenotrophomonas sp. CASM110 TaxID=3111510 RepID=UPI003BF7E6FE